MKGVATATKTLATAAKETPDDIGVALKSLTGYAVDAVRAGRELIGTIDDPILQKAILNTIKGTHEI